MTIMTYMNYETRLSQLKTAPSFFSKAPSTSGYRGEGKPKAFFQTINLRMSTAFFLTIRSGIQLTDFVVLSEHSN